MTYWFLFLSLKYEISLVQYSKPKWKIQWSKPLCKGYWDGSFFFLQRCQHIDDRCRSSPVSVGPSAWSSKQKQKASDHLENTGKCLVRLVSNIKGFILFLLLQWHLDNKLKSSLWRFLVNKHSYAYLHCLSQNIFPFIPGAQKMCWMHFFANQFF